jgi:hypothetical protein
MQEKLLFAQLNSINMRKKDFKLINIRKRKYINIQNNLSNVGSENSILHPAFPEGGGGIVYFN